MILKILAIYFSLSQFYSSILSICIQDKYKFKNYTCDGVQFKQFSVARNDRPIMLAASFYNCKETYIPENVTYFVNLEKLTISCTTINKIHSNAFENLPNLQELNLSSNSISALPDNMFRPVNQLQKLNLTFNRITELSEIIFKHLGDLKELRLSHNNISLLHQKALYSTPELQELYLNFNLITIIPINFFGNSRKVQIIDLSNNHIKIVTDVFHVMQELHFLNLSFNFISDLSVGIFQDVPLRVLDLSHNELRVLHGTSLQLSTLEELHLQSNKISVLDINIGVSKTAPLIYLDVRSNRLVFLEEHFIKSATKLSVLIGDENPWDCMCYSKMQMSRGKFPMLISIDQYEGYKPVCVFNDRKNNNCDITQFNLTYYYLIFEEALE